MKYFIDTEFLEGSQKENFPVSLFRKNTPNTIDLISIGIVAEDGREYYAISKDFNLKEAWNRYDINLVDIGKKKYRQNAYWIRENVLKPIFVDLFIKDNGLNKESLEVHLDFIRAKMDYYWLKKLINKYGKTNKQISKEIVDFIYPNALYNNLECEISDMVMPNCADSEKPEFYAYYADYDWVVFCWLFGKMIDLPKGFPMYCKDLKQILEEKANSLTSMQITDIVFGKGNMKHNVYTHLDSGILKSTKSECLMNAKDYSTPSLKKENEHNALSDARWNKNLYEFLHKF